MDDKSKAIIENIRRSYGPEVMGAPTAAETELVELILNTAAVTSAAAVSMDLDEVVKAVDGEGELIIKLLAAYPNPKDCPPPVAKAMSGVLAPAMMQLQAALARVANRSDE